MLKTAMDMINDHAAAIDTFRDRGLQPVVAAAEIIIDAMCNSGFLYLCGNGGSAADCQHIAGEFVGRFRQERPALPAIAFTTDTSILTCIGNDYRFEDIFARQAEAMITDRDVLWVFSTSGTSKNILAAADIAKKKGSKIIAFVGRQDSPLERIADVCVCAQCNLTSTSQEVHQLAYHIICNIVEQGMVEKKKN